MPEVVVNQSGVNLGLGIQAHVLVALLGTALVLNRLDEAIVNTVEKHVDEGDRAVVGYAVAVVVTGGVFIGARAFTRWLFKDADNGRPERYNDRAGRDGLRR